MRDTMAATSEMPHSKALRQILELEILKLTVEYFVMFRKTSGGTLWTSESPLKRIRD
jgi:hypothetical protein